MAVAQTLADFRRADGRPIVVVLGLLSNKDACGIFASLRPIQPFRLILIGFEAEAAADPIVLAQLSGQAGLDLEIKHDVSAALDVALASDGSPPHILICGRSTWPERYWPAMALKAGRNELIVVQMDIAIRSSLLIHDRAAPWIHA